MAQNQHMQCIKCLVKTADAKSHVVPNSIRQNMYGDKAGKNTKFEFTYIGRKDLPSQDFPKPNLMCRACDSQFGSGIESGLPKLIMPANVDDPKSWDALKLIPLTHGPYKDYPREMQPELKRNAALIAWKVMHAVDRDGSAPDLSEFLQTPAGQALDHAMLHFINSQDLPRPTISLREPVFWKIEPTTAASLTGKNDELPISWAVIFEPKKPETASIFAVFGLWVVGWQFPQAEITLECALAKWLLHLLEQKKKLTKQ